MMKTKVVRVSSSINNFRQKILARYNLPEYKFPRDIYKPVIFFGLYHFLDWCRFILHRGQKTVFWTGGDILNLSRNKKWQWLIARQKAKHITENDVEKLLLKSMGIDARVQPIILDDPSKFTVCFRPSNKPQVYVCCHPGYEEQYGVNLLEGIAAVVPDVTLHVYGVTGESHDNIKYHGFVENSRFNEEIKQYQCAARLNDFDGFGEICAKALLMNQYVISRISYPFVTYVKDTTDLIAALNDLKNKKEPNYKAAEFWRRELTKPLL